MEGQLTTDTPHAYGAIQEIFSSTPIDYKGEAVKLLISLILSAFLAAPALAEESHEHGHADGKMMGEHAPACSQPSLACAISATPAFGPDGRLWLIWSAAGRVFVTASPDRGESFSGPVEVSTEPAIIDDTSESRPKLVVTPDGILVVTYTVRPDHSYNGTIFFSRSVDEGRSFSPPQPLIEDASQRFDSLGVSPNGRIYIAWLDKRSSKQAKAAEQSYVGIAVAMAWSDDAGASFQGKEILAEHSCECCRVAISFDQDGLPVMAWRHVFGKNLRDHVVGKLSSDGSALPYVRVAEDEWAIDACPHHGPALAIDKTGVRHVAWYTAGKRRQGLFYAHSEDGGQSYSDPVGFGGGDQHVASHPQLLALTDRLILAWKDFDGTTTTVQAQQSTDGGKIWTAPRTMAETTDASDHPLLLANEGKAYLSWLTKIEGYRFLSVPEEN